MIIRLGKSHGNVLSRDERRVMGPNCGKIWKWTERVCDKNILSVYILDLDNLLLFYMTSSFLLPINYRNIYFHRSNKSNYVNYIIKLYRIVGLVEILSTM